MDNMPCVYGFMTTRPQEVRDYFLSLKQYFNIFSKIVAESRLPVQVTEFE